MNVFHAYGLSWSRFGLVVPTLLAVRLISFAVIAPLVGVAVRAAISASGQSALTDFDIASYLLSPLGFLLFLLVGGLILLATVFGFAVMTLGFEDPGARGFRAIGPALSRVASRFVPLLRFAVEFVLRVTAILLPFAVAGLLIYGWLLTDYDINYYLTARPREFLIAVALGVVLVLALAAVLIRVLLDWSVALHHVLHDSAGPHAAFAASRASLSGRRAELAKALVLWLALRIGLGVLVSVLFVWAIRTLPGLFGGGVAAQLHVAMALAAIWAVAGLVVAAVALGALAVLLDARYDGTRAALEIPATRAPAVGMGVVLLVCAVIAFFAMNRALVAPPPAGEVIVIAHRGASGSRPENTLASLRQAVEEGADWVEIDVQEIVDGDVVVMHDSDFMKLSGVDLKIWEATAEDLAGIDIGSWYDPAYAGERVPTLAEALEITRDRARLLIELKYYGHDEDLEARTAAIVEAAGLEDQVAVMSLKYPGVQKMMTLRPDWPAGVLAATSIGDLTGLDGDFIAVSSGVAGPRLARNADAAGKDLYVWTVNDPLEMAAMVSAGVDGLITDHPALAREVIGQVSALDPFERSGLVFLERLGLLGSYRPADEAEG